MKIESYLTSIAMEHLALNMNVHHTDSGYLAMYIGPMYSGKTSALRELHKQHTFCGISTSVINFAEDRRYTTDDVMCTHNKEQVPCTMSNSLFQDASPESDLFRSTQVFLINEGQFFPDVVEWTKMAVSRPYNKSVYICGLDGDFERQTFGNWLDLIPYSDTVEKLTSMCCDCKRAKAIFSFRLTNEKQQKVIGSESYIPLCRGCYEERLMNK